MAPKKTKIICIVFLITINMTPLNLFGSTDSGIILSEERQEKEQRSMQDIEPTPSEVEINKNPVLDTDPKTDATEQDEHLKDSLCDEIENND